MSVAIDELLATISDAIDALVDVNDPEMSDAICADDDNVPAAVTPVNPEPSPVKDPEKDPVKATFELPVCIKSESLLSWDILLPDTITFFQVAMLLFYFSGMSLFINISGLVKSILKTGYNLYLNTILQRHM